MAEQTEQAKPDVLNPLFAPVMPGSCIELEHHEVQAETTRTYEKDMTVYDVTVEINQRPRTLIKPRSGDRDQRDIGNTSSRLGIFFFKATSTA